MPVWQVVLELESGKVVIVDFIEADTEDSALETANNNLDLYKERIEHLLEHDRINRYYVVIDPSLTKIDLEL